jgi:hypothetical protein
MNIFEDACTIFPKADRLLCKSDYHYLESVLYSIYIYR